MSTIITVAVCGAAGRMGREVVRAVSEAPDLHLVAAIDRSHAGADSGELCGIGANGIPIQTDLNTVLAPSGARVMVDFTLPDGLLGNITTALENGIAPVVGTTGLNRNDLDELSRLSQRFGISVFIAPNFAIGAVLMMQFAATAARYMPDVEIIELHHDRKVDSPSGTALLTSQRIGEARASAGVFAASPPPGLVEKVSGARGARAEFTGNVPIHSVRLPGFVAHQEVIFGGPGQILTIRHDSIDRKSFMPGVLLAVRRILDINGLVVGLENLM